MKRLPALSAFAIAAAVTLAARFPDPPRRSTPHTLVSCIPYTPSGTVHIDVNAQQTFAPDSTFCSGFFIRISPDVGIAGFTQGSACDQDTVTTASTGLFKIRGCEPGTVSVTVNQGSTVLQTISVVVEAQ